MWRKPLCSQSQELGDRGDVPVRVGDSGVTDIGGQHIDDVINLLLLVTADQGAAEERVPIMPDPA
jgi:hypothetical protein